MPTTDTHHDTSASAIPAKCSACEGLRQVPFACDDCHQLLAHVQGADYFELFGVPRRYDLDLAELESKYLAISCNIHPDRCAVGGSEMQAFALRASAAVNSAYNILRHPIHRAEYLLESAGGSSAALDRTVPPELLGEVMTLREEIEEARSARNQAALAALRTRLERRRDAIQEQVSALSRDLDAADEDRKGRLREQLNAIKYISNLLGHL